MIPISNNDGKVLKLQIFILDLSVFGSTIKALEGQQELIELKKKELANIQKEIGEVQKTKLIEAENKTFDKEADKLYDEWLTNIKKQLK